jgi:Protein of unknown function (DUF3808)
MSIKYNIFDKEMICCANRSSNCCDFSPLLKQIYFVLYHCRLSLLWYHTIVRPFFALDGSNVQAGVIAAESLITESQEVYGQSALFLFFRGRVERLKVIFSIVTTRAGPQFFVFSVQCQPGSYGLPSSSEGVATARSSTFVSP